MDAAAAAVELHEEVEAAEVEASAAGVAGEALVVGLPAVVAAAVPA